MEVFDCSETVLEVGGGLVNNEKIVVPAGLRGFLQERNKDWI